MTGAPIDDSLNSVVGGLCCSDHEASICDVGATQSVEGDIDVVYTLTLALGLHLEVRNMKDP